MRRCEKEQYQKEVPLRVKANGSKIHRRLKESKNNINFALLDPRTDPIGETDLLVNQIIILYNSGRWEVLPSGINGSKLKDYMGVRLARIQFWSVLPASGAPNNPGGRADKKNWQYPSDKDIYNL